MVRPLLSKCKNGHDLTGDNKRYVSPKGKRGGCIECVGLKYKQNKAYIYWRGLLRRYNISQEQYAVLADYQDYSCAICRGIDCDYLVVDHDHESDKVRGLLCHRCNLALGGFRDDSKLLRRAARYLDYPPAHDADAPEITAQFAKNVLTGRK